MQIPAASPGWLDGEASGRARRFWNCRGESFNRQRDTVAAIRHRVNSAATAKELIMTILKDLSTTIYKFNIAIYEVESGPKQLLTVFGLILTGKSYNTQGTWQSNEGICGANGDHVHRCKILAESNGWWGFRESRSKGQIRIATNDYPDWESPLAEIMDLWDFPPVFHPVVGLKGGGTFHHPGVDGPSRRTGYPEWSLYGIERNVRGK